MMVAVVQLYEYNSRNNWLVYFQEINVMLCEFYVNKAIVKIILLNGQ